MAAIAKGEQRRALMIAGVGFVLVLALFVGSRVLSGGGGGDEAIEPIPPTPAPETTPGTPPAPGGDEVVPIVPIPVVPDSLELAELRDPFTPPLAVIEFLRSLQPVPGAPGQPGGPGSPGIGPEDVTLRDVETDSDGEPFATVDVAGDVFEAAEGERFGPNGEFMVVSLDAAGDCGTFLFGDEAFSLCVGQDTPTPGGQPIPQK